MVTAKLPRNVSLRQRTFHNGTRSPTFCTSAQKKGWFHEVVHRKMPACSLVCTPLRHLSLQIPRNNIYPPAGIYGFGSSSVAWSRSRREKVLLLLKSFSTST